MKYKKIDLEEYKYLKEIERLYMEDEKQAEELMGKMLWINKWATSIKKRIENNKMSS